MRIVPTSRSTTVQRARDRTRSRVGRTLLAAVLVLALGAVAPVCGVASAVAHAAAPEGMAAAAAARTAHSPVSDPACCDQMREASSVPRTLVAPSTKLPEWLPLAPFTTTFVSRVARPPAGAGADEGLPPGSASVPAYLRTLRLRV